MIDINGYTLVEPLQAKDAGFSRWGYGTKDGRQFFIKEFIDPVYPNDERLAERIRKRMLAGAEAFCQKKIAVYEAVNRAVDGNLVPVEDFFRFGSHYYVAMPRITGEKMTMAQVAALPIAQRVLLCMSVAHSVMKLHAQGFVHADIKDTNVLISRTASGNPVGRIVDYDCGFLESDPPASEDDLFGDQVYLSPEGCLFICGETVETGCKMDVFALGLLFHQYLTGKLPAYDTDTFDYAHEAVLEGQDLTISSELSTPLRNLLRRMLLADPRTRCSAQSAFEILRTEYLRVKDLPVPDPEPTPEPEKTQTEWSGRIRTKTNWFTQAGDL